MRVKLDNFIRNVLIIMMSLLVLSVVWQVFTRYVLQSPSTYTDELARFLLIWVSLLGAAYYSGKNEHIAITLFPDRLEGIQKKYLQTFINVTIILFVTAVLLIGGGYLTYLKFTFQEFAPALQISMGWLYLIGPISGLLVLFYKISDLVEIWAS